MENHYKDKKGRYSGAGYATIGYQGKRKRFDRYIYCRLGITNFIICGGNRERKYQTKAERGNCSGTDAWNTIWTSKKSDSQ